MTKQSHRYSQEAEAAVLGGIILDQGRLAELDTLETDDFYHLPHRIVFEAMRNLETAQKPIDVVMLETEIAKRGKLEAIGGTGFLGELALLVPTTDNVIAYAKIVQDAATVRKLAVASSEILGMTRQPDADPGELVSMAFAALTKIDTRRDTTAGPIGEVVKRRVRELEEQWAAKARGETVWLGAPTGVKALDKIIGGYPFGDVVIIAGRPAMGKSALALAATDASVEAGFGVDVFAPEGGYRMYADRLIARRADVALNKLRTGDLSPAESSRISSAMMWYGRRSHLWHLDDRGGLTAADIVRAVRKRRRQLKTRVVVVDYLQILKRRDGASENEALEEIINVFGQAAPGDDIAWVLVSQLNRDVEKRPDKRPQKSDLRGSGALEQVARMVVCPYRGAYYYDEPKRDIDYDCNVCSGDGRCVHAPDADAFQSMAQVIICKNNNGPEGRVFCTWNGPTVMLK